MTDNSCDFPRPDVETVAQRLRNEISFRSLNGAPVLPGSVEDAFSYVGAGLFYEMWGALQQKWSQLDLSTMCCDNLMIWAARRNIYMQSSKRSAGYAILSGTADAAIPSGAIWVDASSNQYQLDLSTATNPTALDATGAASVRISSVLGGAAYNLAGGAALTLSSVTTGINQAATLSTAGLTGGTDDENCDAFRARLIAMRQNGVISTNQAWYKEKTLEWPGVTRVCFDDCTNAPGRNWITIYPFFDGVYPSGIPPQAVLDEMSAWMFGAIPGQGDGIAPVGASGNYAIAGTSQLTVTISGLALSLAAQNLIAANIKQTLFESVCVGGTICKSLITNAISAVTGASCYSAITYILDANATQDGVNIYLSCGHAPILNPLNWS